MKKMISQLIALLPILLPGLVASTIGMSVGAQTPPVAKLTSVVPLPASAPPPFSVSFSALASTCSSLCQAHFDFGDGNVADVAPGDFLLAGNTYLLGGSYTATVTLTDSNGKKASASLSITITKGQTLGSYLNDCETQLGFQDANIPTNLSCNNAVLFAPNSIEGNTLPTDLVNDAVGYARVTDNVDLTFACRWLTNNVLSPTDGTVRFVPPFEKAQSVEMLIHNRQNGNTCFFEAAPRTIATSNGGAVNAVPATLVSLAVAARAAPNTSEAKFWYEPLALDNTLQCVDCHIAGPYIATPRIAPTLAQFGLLNNGHDTLGRYKDANNNVVGRFHAVGTTLVHFNDLAFSNNNPNTCANGCHSIGDKGAVNDVIPGGVQQLLPSITHVIDSAGNQRPSVSVTTSGVMPANAAPFDYSDYRWVNMDTPTNDDGDYETLIGLKQQYPQFYCKQPIDIVANVVGSPYHYSPNIFPDKLNRFNLQDGLVCLNADQSGGTCHDYQTRYKCGGWTAWQNQDDPRGTGDWEKRAGAGVCDLPTAIQARYNAGTTQSPNWIIAHGPPDRLAEFDNQGLICKNADQTNGQCSNYVVQFACDTPMGGVSAPTPLAKGANSNNIGTDEKTYVVTTLIAGWQASNITGRQIYVNGVAVTPGQWPLPPRTMDGKYYFTFSAGGLVFASWSIW